MRADQVARISTAYTSEALYGDVMHQEMDAWMQLARAGAQPELRRAIRYWHPYAQRLALTACIHIVRIERVLDAGMPAHAAAAVCPEYRLEMDPELIFRKLREPMPSLKTM